MAADRLGRRVADDLLDAIRISPQLIGLLDDVLRQPYVGGRRIAGMPTHDVVERPFDGEDPRRQRAGIILHPRELEQVGDNPFEAARLVSDGPQVCVSRLRRDREVRHCQRGPNGPRPDSNRALTITRGTNPTSNLADGLFADSLSAELVTPTGNVTSGYTASFQIGVAV